MKGRTCRVCGCTDEDCTPCIQRQGFPCYWTEVDLCSACDPQEAAAARRIQAMAAPAPGPPERLQIEPTDTLMTVDGIPVRVWNGISEAGSPCLVLVHRIIVWNPDQNTNGWIPMPPPKTITTEEKTP